MNEEKQMIKTFPHERYQYKKIKNEAKDGKEAKDVIIASSTFAGKKVYAKAIYKDGEEFSEATGREWAAAKCDRKIARMRFKKAFKAKFETEALVEKLMEQLKSDEAYLEEAKQLYVNSAEAIDNLFDGTANTVTEVKAEIDRMYAAEKAKKEAAADNKNKKAEGKN